MLRRSRGAHRRCRAVDDRHRAPKRTPARRGAGLGGAARAIRGRLAAPSARVTPGIIVYRLDDRLFFANARYFNGRVREAIRAAPAPVAWLVFDAEAVTHVDSTGLDALDQLVQELRRRRSRSSSPASGHAWRSCSRLQASPRRSDANGSTRRSAWPSPSAFPPRRPQRPRANGPGTPDAPPYGATFWFRWKRLSGS